MKIHICNTHIEEELARPSIMPLMRAIENHPIALQLQFLPLLYASDEDRIAVTNLSEGSDERLILLDDPKAAKNAEIAYWGASPQAGLWAAQKGFICSMPPFEVVREVNSKVFSFMNSPKLPNAQLLTSREEMLTYLKGINFAKLMLKYPYGYAGRGNHVFDLSEDGVLDKIAKWACHLPIIAEPYVERILDFSTQWQILPDKTWHKVGATRILNSATGIYSGTIVGPEEEVFNEFLPFVKEHEAIVQPLLEKIALKGYFGYLGVDAMVYNDKGKYALQPIVEINARQTMALCALWTQERIGNHRVLTLRYTKENLPLKKALPDRILTQAGKEVVFHRNIYIQ